jgi:hypothetical protein
MRQVSRPRHQDKDIEVVLREAEARGWTVYRDKGYYKAKCPCGQHANWSIKLTPSNPNYAKNLAAWFQRQSCWEEAGHGGL